MSNLQVTWYPNNDMRVRLDTLQSSTMASGTYLNGSTNVTAAVWSGRSTSTGVLVKSATLTYTTGSNGRYDHIFQSTDTAAKLLNGGRGFVVTSVHHLGLDGEFRQEFIVHYRGTT